MNLYIEILIETAWNASIVPFGSDVTLYAMKAFGTFDMRMAASMAILGGIAGQLFNWGVGYVMLQAKRRGAHVMKEETYAKAQRFFQRYLVWLLIFSWLPLLKFLVLAAGFFGTRLKILLPLVAIGYALHYGAAVL